MVLAERAAQITSEASDRQNQTLRPEHPKRLFLDRVQRHGRDLAIIDADDSPLFILPCFTDTCLSGFQITLMHAHSANCFHFYIPFL